MERSTDLLILGSGSTAFAAALRAQELGKTAVMTEERMVGGTCVNRGCLPSKNLIEAARIVHNAANPRYPGLQPVRLTVDFPTLVAQKDAVVSEYRHKKYEALVDGNVSIEHGHARFLDSHTVEVGGNRITGDKVLIATGSRPVVPDIEGLDRVPYLTSDLLTSGEAMELTELPRSLLIIGGGYIALELGQMFQRLGSAVTIVERNRQLLAHGFEPEAGRSIGPILQAEGVKVVTDAFARKVRRESGEIVVTIDLEDGTTDELRAEQLLLAVGRRPNTDLIDIENAGVALAATGSVIVDERLQTNVEHIYAAGDVIGTLIESQMATPVGSQDGGIAAHNALSGQDPRRVNHRVIPRVIFTDPEIAVVGMTEAEAIEAGHQCWCNTLPMSIVPRAGAIRDTRGLIKMVADNNTHEVLGVMMVGHNAAEIIHEAMMAMRFRATLHDFIGQFHVYPTMAEALKIIAISRFKDPNKLSCCAE